MSIAYNGMPIALSVIHLSGLRLFLLRLECFEGFRHTKKTRYIVPSLLKSAEAVIISLRTEVRDVQPLNRTSYAPSYVDLL